jgi:hypothetical protein
MKLAALRREWMHPARYAMGVESDRSGSGDERDRTPNPRASGMGVCARSNLHLHDRSASLMQPPKPLPTAPGKWAGLYSWLNHLLAYSISTAPVPSSTVFHDRTSKGTIHRVKPGGETTITGGTSGIPRWG